MSSTMILQPEPARLSTLDDRNSAKNLRFQTSALEMPTKGGQEEVYELGSMSTSQIPGRRLSSDKGLDDDFTGSLPSPISAVETVERWNSSRNNVYRTLACFWSLLVLGANDAALGPLIPYLQDYYGLSYAVVSLLFLSPLVGYSAASLLNDWIHHRFGRRGVAVIGPVCHMIAYLVACLHPPFPLLVVFFILAGFGNGVIDAAWNAWMGNMANSNEVLGFLHGFYGLGATVAPLIATTLVTKAAVPWWFYYYVMIGFAAVEIASSLPSFWKDTGAKYREEHPLTTDNQGKNRLKEALFRKPAARVTWGCTAFITVYVGAEVGLGGWITEFMLKERDASAFAAGMSTTGFWLGLTVGRFVLGFITPRIGEKRAIMIYLPIVMGLELIFWLVPRFYVSVVAVSFQGFFLGPLFPAAIVAATRLLPRHLHVTAIGFMAAVGGSGAAIFPFAVGAIAQAKGVQVLQPIIMSLLAVCFLTWCSLPSMHKKRD